MNKSDSNIIFVLATTIVAILSLSYLFDNDKKKRELSFDLDKDGFDSDRKSFQKDFNRIATDMNKASKNISNVI